MKSATGQTKHSATSRARFVILATVAGLAVGVLAGFQLAQPTEHEKPAGDRPQSVAPGDGWASLAEVRDPVSADRRDTASGSAAKHSARAPANQKEAKAAGKSSTSATGGGGSSKHSQESSRKGILSELRALERAPASETKNRRRQELIEKWSESDPAAAADYAAALWEMGEGGEQLLRSATAAYAKANVAAAAAWAASLRTPLVRDAAIREVMEVWSKRDPLAAAGAVSLLPVGSAQTTAAATIAKQYARADLDGALTWMDSLHGAVQSAAFKSILGDLWQGGSAADVASALPWILGLKSPALRAQGLRFVGSELALRQDALSALGQAMMVPDENQREWFVQSVMDGFTRSNPRGAAAWLLTPGASPYASTMIDKVVSGWAAFEPGAAAQWASNVGDPALRGKSVVAATRTWSQTAPTDTANWIATLQDAGTRDAALGALSSAIVRTDPSAAAYYASNISDANARTQAVVQAVTEWKKRDAIAARSFVDTAAFLPNKTRQSLLK